MGRIDRAGGRHRCGKDTVNNLDAPSKGNDMGTQTHVQATKSKNWEGLFNDSDAFTSCRSDNVARWPKCIKWHRQSTHFLELSGKLRHGPLRSPGLHEVQPTSAANKAGNERYTNTVVRSRSHCCQTRNNASLCTGDVLVCQQHNKLWMRCHGSTKWVLFIVELHP